MESINTLVYHILPKLPITVLRRIVSLNHQLFTETSKEFFWKRLLGIHVPLRHDDVTIESIRLGSKLRGASKPRPYFWYALMYVTEANSMVYHENIKELMPNEWSKLVDEISYDLDEPISKIYVQGNQLYILTLDNNLYWWMDTEKPLGSAEGLSYKQYSIGQTVMSSINYSKIVKFANISRVSSNFNTIRKQLVYSLTTDGSIAKLWRYLSRPKIFPYPERIVDISVRRDYLNNNYVEVDDILLITASGRVLISDETLQKFTELAFSTPILKGILGTQYSADFQTDFTYINLLSNDGRLIEGILEDDRFVQQKITPLSMSAIQEFIHRQEHLNRYEL